MSRCPARSWRSCAKKGSAGAGRRRIRSSKDEAQAAELDELVEKTFEGSLPAFIAAFARKTKLSQDEVDRLRAMIDGYEEKRP